MESYDELVALVEGVRDDVVKCTERGNKAAGTRVRAAMQAIKQAAQHVRKDVLGLRAPKQTGQCGCSSTCT